MKKQKTKRKRRFLEDIFSWEKLYFLGAFLVLCAVMVIGTPFRCLSQGITNRRKRATAKSFPCAVCDTVIGLEGLILGETQWCAFQQELRSRHSFRYKFDAVCATCGLRYVFASKTKTFSVATLQ